MAAAAARAAAPFSTCGTRATVAAHARDASEPKREAHAAQTPQGRRERRRHFPTAQAARDANAAARDATRCVVTPRGGLHAAGAYHGHGRRGGCASERGLHCSLVFVEAVDLLFGGDEQLAALAFHLQAHAWRGASAAAARMRTCAATCLAEAIRAAALAHGAKRCSCGCCASECALKQLSGAARGNAN